MNHIHRMLVYVSFGALPSKASDKTIGYLPALFMSIEAAERVAIVSYMYADLNQSRTGMQ